MAFDASTSSVVVVDPILHVLKWFCQSLSFSAGPLPCEKGAIVCVECAVLAACDRSSCRKEQKWVVPAGRGAQWAARDCRPCSSCCRSCRKTRRMAGKALQRRCRPFFHNIAIVRPCDPRQKWGDVFFSDVTKHGLSQDYRNAKGPRVEFKHKLIDLASSPLLFLQCGPRCAAARCAATPITYSTPDNAAAAPRIAILTFMALRPMRPLKEPFPFSPSCAGLP